MPYKHASQILIENELGEFLCVSRKDNHNLFGLPGGKSESGETPLDTAIRETREETGFDLLGNNLPLIFSKQNNSAISFTFYAKVKKNEFKINHDEPHIVKWGTSEDLINGAFPEYNKALLDNYNLIKLYIINQ